MGVQSDLVRPRQESHPVGHPEFRNRVDAYRPPPPAFLIFRSDPTAVPPLETASTGGRRRAGGMSMIPRPLPPYQTFG